MKRQDIYGEQGRHPGLTVYELVGYLERLDYIEKAAAEGGRGG